MATMIVLFLLAHSPDEDAAVLLVLAIPAFILIFYALSLAVGRKYEPSPDGDWKAIDEEDEE